jgi:putative spermidine/putrescine transport system ATP-binding protein
VTLDVGGKELFVTNLGDDTYFNDPIKVGDTVAAHWSTDDVHILSRADTGTTLDPYGEEAAA